MPDQDEKGKKTERATEKKSHGASSRKSFDVKRFWSLLNVPASKQQLPALKTTGTPKSQQKFGKAHTSKTHWQESTESVELEKFSVYFKNERNFSQQSQHSLFLDIFMALMKNRLGCREWIDRAPPVHLLRVLICLRLLIRDPFFQGVLHQINGINTLTQYMQTTCNTYLSSGEDEFNIDKLVNMTYIFQKLAAAKEQREWIIQSGAHKTLIRLLAARDSNVLLGALLALTSLAESPECRSAISELSLVESLMIILHEYDLLSRRLSAELLRLLCSESEVKEQVKVYDGVPTLLSLLHSDHLKLLWSVVWILVQICEDPEISVEIRTWGGVKQLLHLLKGEQYLVSDRSSIGSLSSANAAGRIQHLYLSEDLSPREIQENTLSLQAACCAALTELVLNDTNAHQVVQENGVYIIGMLILPSRQNDCIRSKSILLQCYAFRALRFLFSMERNRDLFKRFFPPDLFEMFIDIGHYVRDISAYEDLVSKLNSLPEDELKQVADGIEGINQNKTPTKFIGNYAILDHLGSGAFGSVYKVRKRSGQNLLAMKEINLHNPAFGKDKRDRDSSAENIVSELTIIREQLCHPNIVRYYRTFLENDKVYIVMELIEGASLGEHFKSLKEKKQQFTEERLWHIFLQLCLALRYLHKEKWIVHRDLSPNNIMLGERDKVTVTDFGLAKQKQENSKLTSIVGTILYSCPEVVKSEPYGEKADVWAAGCILYQMATLTPPFHSTNMLSLATKIVEAVYVPVPEGMYSEKVSNTIKRCLTSDADLRPDIVEVCALISDITMRYMDNLSSSQIASEKKLERERKRAQKYFIEANKNTGTYRHRHPSLPYFQDHYEKSSISSSSSSSGIASCKSDFSESAIIPLGLLQPHDKESDVFLPNQSYSMDNAAKDVFSELEDETDMSYNSSCSSYIKGRTQGTLKRSASAPRGDISQARETTANAGSKSRPALLPFDLLLKVPSLVFRSQTRKLATSLGTGWPAHSFPPVVFHSLKNPASAGIAVSQRKVRQISDPIQQILIQLHKIIYITQLPPALHDNLKRRVVERYKKSLFSLQSNPCNLKAEMQKVLQGSPELIEIFTDDCHGLMQLYGKSSLTDDKTGTASTFEFDGGITYEQLQNMIEEMLEDSGYYSLNSNR
ncbi:serine/threonine-protein kinase Nek10 isoform X1 [Rana temporaria]|uniref:serine/threonine-protein kinase Nek10 isoform X1 n=1 Tax=Rana temporaria TaxID=8407 RepID=UPI001AAD850A|nr:serine/threonine-protein kinase Nek10 isoform X1 [Rana temporaria]